MRSLDSDRRAFHIFAFIVTFAYWIALFFLSGMVKSLRVIGPGFWQRVTVGVLSICVIGVALSRVRS